MRLACGTYNLTGAFNSGYEFSSWSKSGSGSITNTGTLSTTYTVNGTGSITLNGKSSIPTMQNFTLAQCRSSSDTTVVDSRDNNTYTVRYINGSCWMTQNLRLSGGRTLTPADSNVASNWSFPSTSLTSGDSYTDARYAVDSTYGGYYNLCAVSAGTKCTPEGVDYFGFSYDICPAGWQAPNKNQLNAIVLVADTAMPFFAYSGYYSDGSLYSVGSSGNWWSRSAHVSGDTPGTLWYYNNKLSVIYLTNTRLYGLPVRCVLKSS